jgi:sigma-E factor negative regulatory protein RseC
MSNTEIISHDGIVEVSDNNGLVEVIINSSSACSGCNARTACGMGSETQKRVVVRSDRHFSRGDRVTVTMEQSQGTLAVVIGYLIPLTSLIIAFIIFTMIGFGELLTCLLSFAVLAGCYFVIWLLRGKIEKKFTFKIKD